MPDSGAMICLTVEQAGIFLSTYPGLDGSREMVWRRLRGEP